MRYTLKLTRDDVLSLEHCVEETIPTIRNVICPEVKREHLADWLAARDYLRELRAMSKRLRKLRNS